MVQMMVVEHSLVVIEGIRNIGIWMEIYHRQYILQ